MQTRLLNPNTDLPAVAALINRYETDPVTPEQVAGWLAQTPPGRDICRWVANDEQGKVIAYAYANHENWQPAGKYDVWAIVEPAHRGRRLGAAMLDTAIAYARQHGASALTSETREEDALSLGVLMRRGFAITRHRFESYLDLAAFDETPFREIEARVAASGIRIQALAERGDTREELRKLYNVNYATALDIPGSEEDWNSFEDFERMVREADWFHPAGQFGALDGEEWIGLGAVRLIPQIRGAYNLMTGVLPAYRGRGIATALKLAGIRYARAQGALSMRTHNDSLNAPMLAVNRRLGYIPRSGIYSLLRAPA